MATKEEMKATLVKLQAEVDNLKKQIETVPSSSDWVKEFLKGEWVIHCANETEAASFLTTCKEAGITWCSGFEIDVAREKTRNNFHAYGKGIEFNASCLLRGATTKLINFADLINPVKEEPQKFSFEDFLSGKCRVTGTPEQNKILLNWCRDAEVKWMSDDAVGNPKFDSDYLNNTRFALVRTLKGEMRLCCSQDNETPEINFSNLVPPTPKKNTKLTMEKFKEGMITVECNTSEEAETFLTWCRDAGIKWAGDFAITPKDYRHTNLFCMEEDEDVGEGMFLYYHDDDYPRVNFTDVVPPAPSTDKIIENHIKALGSMMTAMALGSGIPKAFLGYEESLPGSNPTRTFEEFMRGLFCVNCATQEEVETFYTWCNHFGLTWAGGNKVIFHDDKTWNRFVMNRIKHEMRMFYNATPEHPVVNFSDIIPPIENVKLTVADVHAYDYIEVKVTIPPPLPMFTFEAFLNREICVNFQTEEERRIFWDWCKNADVNWVKLITEDRWKVFRTEQRWVASPSIYNDDRKYLCYDACDDVPEVQFTQIIPPVKPEPPKSTYTLEGFLNGEFCVNFDSNEERGILFDLLYDRLDWSRFIGPNRTYLRGLYQNGQQWYVVRNAHKGTKELFIGADEKDFPVEVKFKDMNLFSADIFGAGNVAVCFDGDNKKNDLLYFFAWCRKHRFHFKPSWVVMLNSDFIYDAGYIIMIDGLLYHGHQLTNRDRTNYRVVNFSDIKPLLGEVMVHTMEDFKNKKFCIVYDKEDATEANHKLLSDWCEANDIRVFFDMLNLDWLNRFVVHGSFLLHNALDNVPAVNFKEIKHLLGGR